MPAEEFFAGSDPRPDTPRACRDGKFPKNLHVFFQFLFLSEIAIFCLTGVNGQPSIQAIHVPRFLGLAFLNNDEEPASKEKSCSASQRKQGATTVCGG
jgi:hypothetical protein